MCGLGGGEIKEFADGDWGADGARCACDVLWMYQNGRNKLLGIYMYRRGRYVQARLLSANIIMARPNRKSNLTLRLNPRNKRRHKLLPTDGSVHCLHHRQQRRRHGSRWTNYRVEARVIGVVYMRRNDIEERCVAGVYFDTIGPEES